MDTVEKIREDSINLVSWQKFKNDNKYPNNVTTSDDDWEWFNKQLYNTIFLKCEGTPVDQLRNLTERGTTMTGFGDERSRLKGILGGILYVVRVRALMDKECNR